LAALPECLISFGSNLGDRLDRVRAAAELLRGDWGTERLTCSRLFETPAVGGPDGQSPFLNGAAVLRTGRSARQVLELLQSIEQKLGRERKVRWDARPIDLDVILYGAWIGGDWQLTLPHPRLAARAFVLEPACDVAGDWHDPRCGWSLDALRTHLRAAVPSLALAGGTAARRREVCVRLTREHAIATLLEPEEESVIDIRGHGPLWVEPTSQRRGVEPAKHLDPPHNRPWVAAFVPKLPPLDAGVGLHDPILHDPILHDPILHDPMLPHPILHDPTAPRVIAVMDEGLRDDVQWPDPHRLWPARQGWPEYRLPATDLDWAVGEIVAALDSMNCQLQPVVEANRW
jgi:2-amino-4-hydroxy-6-hydroxymethyldihydropteridine diphosphokinase